MGVEGIEILNKVVSEALSDKWHLDRDLVGRWRL